MFNDLRSPLSLLTLLFFSFFGVCTSTWQIDSDVELTDQRFEQIVDFSTIYCTLTIKDGGRLSVWEEIRVSSPSTVVLDGGEFVFFGSKISGNGWLDIRQHSNSIEFPFTILGSSAKVVDAYLRVRGASIKISSKVSFQDKCDYFERGILLLDDHTNSEIIIDKPNALTGSFDLVMEGGSLDFKSNSIGTSFNLDIRKGIVKNLLPSIPKGRSLKISNNVVVSQALSTSFVVNGKLEWDVSPSSEVSGISLSISDSGATADLVMRRSFNFNSVTLSAGYLKLDTVNTRSFASSTEIIVSGGNFNLLGDWNTVILKFTSSGSFRSSSNTNIGTLRLNELSSSLNLEDTIISNIDLGQLVINNEIELPWRLARIVRKIQITSIGYLSQENCGLSVRNMFPELELVIVSGGRFKTHCNTDIKQITSSGDIEIPSGTKVVFKSFTMNNGKLTGDGEVDFDNVELKNGEVSLNILGFLRTVSLNINEITMSSPFVTVRSSRTVTIAEGNLSLNQLTLANGNLILSSHTSLAPSFFIHSGAELTFSRGSSSRSLETLNLEGSLVVDQYLSCNDFFSSNGQLLVDDGRLVTKVLTLANSSPYSLLIKNGDVRVTSKIVHTGSFIVHGENGAIDFFNSDPLLLGLTASVLKSLHIKVSSSSSQVFSDGILLLDNVLFLSGTSEITNVNLDGSFFTVGSSSTMYFGSISSQFDLIVEGNLYTTGPNSIEFNLLDLRHNLLLGTDLVIDSLSWNCATIEQNVGAPKLEVNSLVIGSTGCGSSSTFYLDTVELTVLNEFIVEANFIFNCIDCFVKLSSLDIDFTSFSAIFNNFKLDADEFSVFENGIFNFNNFVLKDGHLELSKCKVESGKNVQIDDETVLEISNLQENSDLELINKGSLFCKGTFDSPLFSLTLQGTFSAESTIEIRDFIWNSGSVNGKVEVTSLFSSPNSGSRVLEENSLLVLNNVGEVNLVDFICNYGCKGLLNKGSSILEGDLKIGSDDNVHDNSLFANEGTFKVEGSLVQLPFGISNTGSITFSNSESINLQLPSPESTSFDCEGGIFNFNNFVLKDGHLELSKCKVESGKNVQIDDETILEINKLQENSDLELINKGSLFCKGTFDSPLSSLTLQGTFSAESTIEIQDFIWNSGSVNGKVEVTSLFSSPSSGSRVLEENSLLVLNNVGKVKLVDFICNYGCKGLLNKGNSILEGDLKIGSDDNVHDNSLFANEGTFKVEGSLVQLPFGISNTGSITFSNSESINLELPNPESTSFDCEGGIFNFNNFVLKDGHLELSKCKVESGKNVQIEDETILEISNLQENSDLELINKGSLFCKGTFDSPLSSLTLQGTFSAESTIEIQDFIWNSGSVNGEVEVTSLFSSPSSGSRVLEENSLLVLNNVGKVNLVDFICNYGCKGLLNKGNSILEGDLKIGSDDNVHDKSLFANEGTFKVEGSLVQLPFGISNTGSITFSNSESINLELPNPESTSFDCEGGIFNFNNFVLKDGHLELSKCKVESGKNVQIDDETILEINKLQENSDLELINKGSLFCKGTFDSPLSSLTLQGTFSAESTIEIQDFIWNSGSVNGEVEVTSLFSSPSSGSRVLEENSLLVLNNVGKVNLVDFICNYGCKGLLNKGNSILEGDLKIGSDDNVHDKSLFANEGTFRVEGSLVQLPFGISNTGSITFSNSESINLELPNPESTSFDCEGGIFNFNNFVLKDGHLELSKCKVESGKNVQIDDETILEISNLQENSDLELINKGSLFCKGTFDSPLSSLTLQGTFSAESTIEIQDFIWNSGSVNGEVEVTSLFSSPSSGSRVLEENSLLMLNNVGKVNLVDFICNYGCKGLLNKGNSILEGDLKIGSDDNVHDNSLFANEGIFKVEGSLVQLPFGISNTGSITFSNSESINLELPNPESTSFDCEGGIFNFNNFVLKDGHLELSKCKVESGKNVQIDDETILEISNLQENSDLELINKGSLFCKGTFDSPLSSLTLQGTFSAESTIEIQDFIWNSGSVNGEVEVTSLFSSPSSGSRVLEENSLLMLNNVGKVNLVDFICNYGCKGLLNKGNSILEGDLKIGSDDNVHDNSLFANEGIFKVEGSLVQLPFGISNTGSITFSNSESINLELPSTESTSFDCEGGIFNFNNFVLKDGHLELSKCKVESGKNVQIDDETILEISNLQENSDLELINKGSLFCKGTFDSPLSSLTLQGTFSAESTIEIQDFIWNSGSVNGKVEVTSLFSSPSSGSRVLEENSLLVLNNVGKVKLVDFICNYGCKGLLNKGNSILEGDLKIGSDDNVHDNSLFANEGTFKVEGSLVQLPFGISNTGSITFSNSESINLELPNPESTSFDCEGGIFNFNNFVLKDGHLELSKCKVESGKNVQIDDETVLEISNLQENSDLELINKGSLFCKGTFDSPLSSLTLQGTFSAESTIEIQDFIWNSGSVNGEVEVTSLFSSPSSGSRVLEENSLLVLNNVGKVNLVDFICNYGCKGLLNKGNSILEGDLKIGSDDNVHDKSLFANEGTFKVEGSLVQLPFGISNTGSITFSNSVRLKKPFENRGSVSIKSDFEGDDQFLNFNFLNLGENSSILCSLIFNSDKDSSIICHGCSIFSPVESHQGSMHLYGNALLAFTVLMQQSSLQSLNALIVFEKGITMETSQLHAADSVFLLNHQSFVVFNSEVNLNKCTFADDGVLDLQDCDIIFFEVETLSDLIISSAIDYLLSKLTCGFNMVKFLGQGSPSIDNLTTEDVIIEIEENDLLVHSFHNHGTVLKGSTLIIKTYFLSYNHLLLLDCSILEILCNSHIFHTIESNNPCAVIVNNGELVVNGSLITLHMVDTNDLFINNLITHFVSSRNSPLYLNWEVLTTRGSSLVVTEDVVFGKNLTVDGLLTSSNSKLSLNGEVVSFSVTSEFNLDNVDLVVNGKIFFDGLLVFSEVKISGSSSFYLLTNSFIDSLSIHSLNVFRYLEIELLEVGTLVIDADHEVDSNVHTENFTWMKGDLFSLSLYSINTENFFIKLLSSSVLNNLFINVTQFFSIYFSCEVDLTLSSIELHGRSFINNSIVLRSFDDSKLINTGGVYLDGNDLVLFQIHFYQSHSGGFYSYNSSIDFLQTFVLNGSVVITESYLTMVNGELSVNGIFLNSAWSVTGNVSVGDSVIDFRGSFVYNFGHLHFWDTFFYVNDTVTFSNALDADFFEFSGIIDVYGPQLISFLKGVFVFTEATYSINSIWFNNTEFFLFLDLYNSSLFMNVDKGEISSEIRFYESEIVVNSTDFVFTTDTILKGPGKLILLPQSTVNFNGFFQIDPHIEITLASLIFSKVSVVHLSSVYINGGLITFMGCTFGGNFSFIMNDGSLSFHSTDVFVHDLVALDNSLTNIDNPLLVGVGNLSVTRAAFFYSSSSNTDFTISKSSFTESLLHLSGDNVFFNFMSLEDSFLTCNNTISVTTLFLSNSSITGGKLHCTTCSVDKGISLVNSTFVSDNSLTISSMKTLFMLDHSIFVIDSKLVLSYMSSHFFSAKNSSVEFLDVVLFENVVFIFETACYFHQNVIISNAVLEFTNIVHVDSEMTLNTSTLLIENLMVVDGVLNGNSTDDLVLTSMAIIQVYGHFNLGECLNVVSGIFIFEYSSSFNFVNIELTNGEVEIYGSIRDELALDSVLVSTSNLLFQSFINSISIESFFIYSGTVTFNNISTLQVFDLEFQGGNLYFEYFENALFFEKLIVTGSFVFFNTGFPVITTYLLFQHGEIYGEDPLLVLSELNPKLSLIEGSCCPSHYCEFFITDHQLNQSNLIILGESSADVMDFDHSEANIQLITANNIYPYFEINILVEISTNQKFQLLSINVPVCPPIIHSVSNPGTRGGEVTITGENFGSAAAVVSLSPMEFSIVVSPVTHFTILFDIISYTGCHKLTIKVNHNGIADSELCFVPPELTFLEPKRLPFSGILVLNGMNFGLLPIDIQLVNATFSSFIEIQQHDRLVINFDYICSEQSFVVISVAAGGQSSNSLLLRFESPFLEVNPRIIPSQNAYFTITLPFSSFFSECLSYSLLHSGFSSNFTVIGRDSLLVNIPHIDDTSSLVQLEVLFINKSEIISSEISLYVTTITATEPEYICFVSAPCTIMLYSSDQSFKFSNLAFLADSFVEFLSYETNGHYVTVNFVSRNSGFISFCVEIFDGISLEFCPSGLPHIFELPQINQKLFHFFGTLTSISFELQLERAYLYPRSTWTKSLFFGDSVELENIEVLSSTLEVSLKVHRRGTYPLFSIHELGYSSSLGVSFEVDSFVGLPLQIPHNAMFTVNLVTNIQDLFLEKEGQSIPLLPGFQKLLFLEPFYFFIKNFANTQIVRPKVLQFSHNVLDYFGPDVTFRAEITFSSSLVVNDLNVIGHNVSVEDFEVLGSHLAFNIVTSALGSYSVQISNQIDGVGWFWNVSSVVVDPPNTSVKSPNILNLAIHDTLYIKQEPFFGETSVYLNETLSDFIANENGIFEIFVGNVVLPRSQKAPIVLGWFINGFNPFFIENLVLVNLTITSVSDGISVLIPRDIDLEITTVDSSWSLNCEVFGVLFVAQIVNHHSHVKISCLNVLSPVYDEFVDLFLVVEGISLAKTVVEVDAIFVELCYPQTELFPKITNQHIISTNTNQFSLITNEFRCCFGVCSEFYPTNSSLFFQFDTFYDVYIIIVVFNSDCEVSSVNAPFFVSFSDDLSGISNFDAFCSSIPNGFIYAVICRLDVISPNLVVTKSVSITPLQDLDITEVEFYGLADSTCISVLDVNQGVNSLENDLVIETFFQESEASTQSFTSKSSFLLFVSGKFNKISSQFLIDSVLVAPLCVNKYKAVQLVHLPGDFGKFSCMDANVTSTVLDPFDDVSLKCFCSDDFGFPISCKSLSINPYLMDAPQQLFFQQCSDLICEFSFIFNLPGFFTYSFNFHHHTALVSINFTQTYHASLLSTMSNADPCRLSYFSRRTCVKINLTVLLFEHLPHRNETSTIENTDLVFNAPYYSISISEDKIQLVGYPVASLPLTITYPQLSISTHVIINTTMCKSPKTLVAGECHCPPGYELTTGGNCTPCSIHTYKESHMLSCQVCPLNRVTLEQATTSRQLCLCPMHNVEVQGECRLCPKLASCFYGDISFVYHGFVYNNYTGVITECPLRYRCINSTCRMGYTGDWCQECQAGFALVGSFCLYRSVVFYVLSFVVNVLLFGLVYIIYLYHSQLAVYNDHLIASFKSKPWYGIEQFRRQHHRLLSANMKRPFICPFLLSLLVGISSFDSMLLGWSFSSSLTLLLFPLSSSVPLISVLVQYCVFQLARVLVDSVRSSSRSLLEGFSSLKSVFQGLFLQRSVFDGLFAIQTACLLSTKPPLIEMFLILIVVGGFLSLSWKGFSFVQVLVSIICIFAEIFLKYSWYNFIRSISILILMLTRCHRFMLLASALTGLFIIHHSFTFFTF
ncbi:hypothetical protein P9112_008984 [Eukaryota sp. TZLM1-RC]